MKTIKYALLGLLSLSVLIGCSSATSKSDSKGSYYTQLGVGYLQKGRLDLAALNLEKAIKADPNVADTNHYYALLQERLGNDAKAAKHFQRALSITPQDSNLLNNYGSFLCRTGKYAEAEQAFLSAVRDPLYRTPEFAYTNAGICVRNAGQEAQAEDYFRKALEKNNRFAEALYQMAKLHYEKANYTKAEAFLYRYNESGVAATPESLLLCYQVQNRLNEPMKAESCAARLRTQFPESAAASQMD